MTLRKRKKEHPDPMPSPLVSLIACFSLVDLPNSLPNSRSRFQAVLSLCSFLAFGFSAVSNPSQTACGCVGLAGFTRGSSAFTIAQSIQVSGPRSAIVGRRYQARQILSGWAFGKLGLLCMFPMSGLMKVLDQSLISIC
uniref:Uncharacterized protein n=1 Tax=Opuntia streptacantha TaxID=393608 RepID=A0A7C8YLF2_OPUST